MLRNNGRVGRPTIVPRRMPGRLSPVSVICSRSLVQLLRHATLLLESGDEGGLRKRHVVETELSHLRAEIDLIVNVVYGDPRRHLCDEVWLVTRLPSVLPPLWQAHW